MEYEIIKQEPEMFLSEFNRKIWKLYRQCKSLNIKDSNDEFIELIRRSYIAELFQKKYMVSVSGTQGVGKTTMIMNMYDIPEGYLPEVYGRGENIPVLITECNVNTIQCKVIRVKTDSSNDNFESETLSQQEFYNGVMNPKSGDMYYELIVPYTIFGSEDYSFVLLPGIENSGTVEDNYNRFVLEQTSNTIYLFSSTKMAQNENFQLLNDVKGYFKDTKPLFALTFSDQDKDGNLELKNKLINSIGVNEDQILLVGTDENTIPTWKNELINVLQKYISVKAKTRKKQLQNIDALISKDVGHFLDSLEVKIATSEDICSFSNDIDKIFRKINKKSVAVEEEVKKKLKQSINEIANMAYEDAKKEIGEVKGIKKIAKSVLGKNNKDYDRLEEMAKRLWKNKANDNLFFEVLEAVNRENTMFYDQPIEINSRNVGTKLAISQESLHYYDSVFGNKTAEFSTNNNKRYIENIPFLANEAIRMRLKYNNINDCQDYTINQSIKKNNSGMDIEKNLKYATAQRDLILNGVGILMGVDALDGTINTIPAVFGLFGIELTAAATAGIFAGVGAGILSVQINKKINQDERDDRKIVHTIINTYSGYYYKQLSDSYDKMLELFYEQLKYKLEDKFNVTETQAKVLNSKMLLSDVRRAQASIMESVYEHPFSKE